MRFPRDCFLKSKSLCLFKGQVFLPLIFLVAATAWASSSMKLQFIDMDTNKVIYSVDAYPGFTFVINYHHSVDHQPIYELFYIDSNGDIVLKKTWFKSFGIGMGYWKGRGKLEACGNWTCIDDMDYRLGSFVLRIGAKGVDHTLIINGKKVVNFSEKWAHKRILVRVKHED